MKNHEEKFLAGNSFTLAFRDHSLCQGSFVALLIFPERNGLPEDAIFVALQGCECNAIGPGVPYNIPNQEFKDCPPCEHC
jgi:hypothetical protein